MNGNHARKFRKMYESINSEQIKPHVHLENPNSFSRKRKKPLEDIILCTFLNKYKNNQKNSF